MIAALTNHLWQSTLFGIIAALLTLAMRHNHARVRYGLWLAASLKFLFPFSILIGLGSHLEWHQTPLAHVMPHTIQRFGQPVAPLLYIPASLSAAPRHSSWIPILCAIWFCGCAAALLAWWVRWRRLHALIRTTQPLPEGRETEILRHMHARLRMVSSTARMEPGVFGVWRPVLFWPAGISERLGDSQLEAVLAHEVSHIRRRDNLAAAIHMLVEAIFWFHPLVWWIGTRLVAERENACDQAVLRSRSEPHAYAEGILKVCEYCIEAPLPCVSGVSGSDLKRRIRAILAHRLALDLGPSQRLLLTMAALGAIAAPVWVGTLRSQTATTPLPQVEVASIKPAAPDQRGTFIRPGANGGININNMPLKEMIVLAWRIQPYQISGGPPWMESARFDISAKPDQKLARDEMPLLLQSLLADRFQLKIHHETKELPIYALVLANKDGKLGPQLTESKEGSCTPFDPSKPPPPRDPGKPPVLGCGGMFIGLDRLGGMAIEIDQLAPMFARTLGRTIVNKTGLSGKYDIQMQFAPEQAQLLSIPGGGPPPGASAPPPVDSNAPSLFTALQEQLGLKLESQKGPVDMIVIDHVEKPSEN